MYVPDFVNASCGCGRSSCECAEQRSCGCNRGCSCDRCGCTTQVIVGPPGPRGPMGPMGLRGIQGIPGGLLNFADFYALMPTDNATAIAAGADVAFPRTNAVSGSGITRISDTAFSVANPGTYLVMFNVATTEAGQLALTLNGTELPYTVVGKTDTGNQITGFTLVNTTTPNSVITVRNPAANATPLTLTPTAGGTLPVSAHLVIAQVSQPTPTPTPIPTPTV